MIRRVLIESPYFADTLDGIEENLEYARCCIRDSLLRGEAPFASHLVYTTVFDDNIETERTMGIKAGLAWGAVADVTAVYTDRGISRGMQLGIDDAGAAGRPIEYRQLSDAARVISPALAARRKRKVEIAAQVCHENITTRRGGFAQRKG
jgi:hypothetical protein